jgi:hypothetical protein
MTIQVAKPARYIDEVCAQMGIPNEGVQRIIIDADATQNVIWVYVTMVGARQGFEVQPPELTGGAIVMRQDAY